uniref:Uncharacterized protein n=1 Tax=Sphaerodactylus townsendi TaxID=933632 RepID=A0ACB8GAJ0_9SAUR
MFPDLSGVLFYSPLFSNEFTIGKELLVSLTEEPQLDFIPLGLGSKLYWPEMVLKGTFNYSINLSKKSLIKQDTLFLCSSELIKASEEVKKYESTRGYKGSKKCWIFRTCYFWNPVYLEGKLED